MPFQATRYHSLIVEEPLPDCLEVTAFTRDGEIMGTPAFMAPEQVAERIGAIGPTADVYALGAILYTILTGAPPFGGGSGLDLGKMVAFMAGQTRPVWDFEDIGDWWTRADPAGIADERAVLQARLGVSRAERDLLSARERIGLRVLREEIGAGRLPAGRGLVQDDHRQRPGAIILAEGPSLEQWNAHGLEKRRVHLLALHVVALALNGGLGAGYGVEAAAGGEQERDVAR